MRNPGVLITGAAGEIGHALVHTLHERGADILTLDLKPLDPEIAALVTRSYVGSILDTGLLDTILAEYKVTQVFHLAALLSTRSEFTPVVAHQVNVEGTLNLLEFAQAQCRSHGEDVKFFYPSSIAAHGLPDVATKERAGKITEDQFNAPATMYGCNKLACEHLGRYYAHHYKQLDVEERRGRVDFRSLRFPGLISAFTVPSGGTSDYAPEMLHAAAKSEPYQCFVRPDARIPFMVMPDAIDAIFQLMDAPRTALSREVYNIQAFNPSAEEIRSLVLEFFPKAEIGWKLDAKRMAIVDSWPAGSEDRAAREDWGFAPKFGLTEAFEGYLVPRIRGKYGD